jgi:hypothetical protein
MRWQQAYSSGYPERPKTVLKSPDIHLDIGYPSAPQIVDEGVSNGLCKDRDRWRDPMSVRY